ncbi:hypothetical protein ACFQS6_15550 [Xanthomonas populi]
MRGHSGDEVSIDACGASIRYQWKYRWMSSSANAGWQLQGYPFERVQDCDAAMADPGFFKLAVPRGCGELAQRLADHRFANCEG